MRQRIRKGILVFSTLTFPFTFYFLSPYVIVISASRGILIAWNAPMGVPRKQSA